MKLKIQALACLLAATCMSDGADAGPTPFQASYDGTAKIVAVIDSNGPVVRFETTSSGTGSFDLASYFSTDIVNLGTGAGDGTNRFVAVDGDELFGVFTVQIVPTDTPGVLGLTGTTLFTGGTGRFNGASGSASFSGSGQFISETTALTSLRFAGELSLVPEPASVGLALTGLWLGMRWTRRRPAQPCLEAQS